MNDTRTIEYQTRGAMLTPVSISVLRPPRRTSDPGPSPGTGAVDEALEGSFPASDPPSWTSGIVRPEPEATAPRPQRSTVTLLRDFGRRVAAFF